jgi:hypothetical protein
MTRGRMLAIGVAVALIAVALIALRSGEGASEAGRAATSAPVSAAGTAATAAPSTPAPSVPPVPAQIPRPARDAGPSDVAQVLRATDEHDRALLAAIERQTKASPSQTVYALIALRRQGATREELEQFIARELSGQLFVRVAAQRWLRAVMPRPGIEPQPAPPPMSQGGGKKLQPIEPMRPRRP